MRWPDLSMYGLELGVEDAQQGQRLALRSIDGRAVPLAVSQLGFVMDGVGRWVREDLQLKLAELQGLFPRVSVAEVPGIPRVMDADPLRPLREAMRRAYGASADVDHFQLAQPETAAATRARAMRQLLGVQTVWMRYEGEDPRLEFAGVTLRRKGDRTMFVNVDGPFAAAATLGHEAVHVMRREQPVLYDDLVQAIRPLIDQPAFARYAARLNIGNAGITDRQLSLDEVREEAVADIVGDMLLDDRVWRALDDRGLVERLLEFMKEFLERLAQRWQRSRPVLDGTLGSREMLHDIDAAREAVTATLVAWRDAQRPVPADAAESMAMAFRTIDGPRPPLDMLPQSAVRDTNGRLQVVFRGEWGPVVEDAFDSTRDGALPTFTTSPDVAAVYSMGEGFGGPGRIRAVALDIRAPLQIGSLEEDVVDFGDLCERLTESGKVSEQEVRSAWMQLGDRVRHWDADALATKPSDRDDPEWGTDGYGPEDISGEDYVDTYAVADHPAFVELATRAGFDGFNYMGTFTSSDMFIRSMDEAIADGYDDTCVASVEWRPFRRDQVVGMFSAAIPEALRSVNFRRAFHGSPHAFERPDLSFNLSGEGNNAQGFGFYMAANEGVADGYRKALSLRNRVFRLGDRLARRDEIDTVAAEVFGEDAVLHAVNICSLLEEGHWAGDLADRFEHREEPERTLLKSLLGSIEQVAYGDLAEQNVLLSHRGGSRVLSGASMSAGYFVARREITHYLGEGFTIPDARERVISDHRQNAAIWRASLSDDQAALRDAEQKGHQESIERIRLRMRDSRWYLQESQCAVTLLSDPDTLVFDVQGMVTPGHLYEGEISDTALLLDWDVPLTAQPERVLEALRCAGLDVLANPGGGDDRLGSTLYRDIEAGLGSAEAVSHALMRAGLSGIRYRDGATRFSDGPASWNYVVWDLDALTDFKMKFQRVFHGTPHRFERFDTTHVGAGEGRQAFGWGVYFASRKEVADWYRGKLSSELWYRDQPMERESPRNSVDAAAWAVFLAEGDKEVAKRSGLSTDERINAIDASALRSGGHLYVAEVPEDDELLDWDRKMAAQPEKVRAALEACDFGGDAVIAAWKQNGAWPHVHGETLYRHLAGGLTVGASAEGRHRVASLDLQAIGIPGLRYLDGSRGQQEEQTANYVIWDANVLEASAPALMQFRRADVADGEPPFYSALLAAIERGDGAPRRADASGWKGWLDGAQRRGEFRKAERDWVAVDAWLDAQQKLGGKTFEADLVAEGHMLSPAQRARIRENPGILRSRITREDLAAFVQSHQVRLQEVVYGGGEADAQVKDELQNNLLEIVAKRGAQIGEEDEAIAEYVDGEIDAEELAERLGITVSDVERAEAAAVQDAPEAGKYEEYTLPGGRNYRELLLTLPSTLTPAEVAEGEALYGRPFERLSRREVARRDELLTKGTYASYHTRHFKGVANVLAHVRFNERVDADGQRTLFLEEIQSDWHQKGRKQGYAGNLGDLTAEEDGDLWSVYTADGEIYGRYAALDADDAIRRARRADRASNVPNAPFKGSDEWAMLVFKRMVAWAAERGFDRVAWTTGAQQAERYKLSKKIHALTVTQNDGGRFDIEFETSEGKTQHKRGFDEKGLAALIGNELAVKAVERATAYQAAHNAYREEIRKPGQSEELKRLGAARDAAKMALTLSEVDLRLGGDGMRAFYDQILPAAVNKWARKFDAEVGHTMIQGKSITGVKPLFTTSVHAIDITPSMREAALDGLPLFRRKQADNVVYTRDPSGNLSVQARVPNSLPMPTDAVKTFNETEHNEPAESAYAARF